MDAFAPRCRVVDGLQWVEQAESPWPKSRPRGAKGEGLRFEKALAKRLLGARHGLWFKFQDFNGIGYCSPDFIVNYEQFVLVIEAKLTDTDEGRAQIEQLYSPVLQMHYRRPIRGVLVCKNLRQGSGNIVPDLVSAVRLSENCIPTLQWRGKGPI
jgi:hypothetical protein